MAGAASETVCEGSVLRSPAFQRFGQYLLGLRFLRGRLRLPHTDNCRVDRRLGRGMALGHGLQTARALTRRRTRCRASRIWLRRS
jgi:hypothetical protein